MKALILAAGYAKRLWPLTKNRPKPLLDVKGRPIVEYILSHFNGIPDIDRVFVVTNDKFYHAFEDWAEETDFGLPITIINDTTTSNDDRLGAVGDMQYAIKEARIDDDLLVIAGDNLFEYKLSEFHAFFREKNASIVACKDMGGLDEVRERFGVVELGEKKRLIGFEEKPKEPKSSLAATACYLFTREDVKEIENYLESGNPPDNAGDFVKWLANHRPVYGFIFDGKWFDIGSFENLGKAREEFDG